jgi:hypothetical protein
MNDAERRVWQRMPEGTRDAIARLPTSDLQTLLLSVARERAASVSPPDLLRRWSDDRFVRPSTADPRVLNRIDAHLWRLLPPEFEAVELSPVVPVGTSSAMGGVNQNRVVTTMRSAEVLSDSTNALAIEAAARRRRQPRDGEVHLAASHRVLRAQVFRPGMAAHFPLFTLVSTARDTGSGRTEASLLTRHLAYWHRVLAGSGATLHYTIFANGPKAGVLRERIAGLPVRELAGRERGRHYYRDLALLITDGELELGDGGLTDWTARLLSDVKEKCLVSCLSTERVFDIAERGSW